MMQTPIDYKKVSAIPSPQTVALINNFVINTTQFINKFAYLCEQKLSNVSRNVERLEITMSILEAKLASIPWLDHSAVPQTTTVPSTTVSSSDIPAPPPLGGSGPTLNTSNTSNNDNNSEEPAPPEPLSSVPRVKDDPRYAPFFRKLKVGVPDIMLKQQMSVVGLNPDLLDTPDAPMPGGVPTASPSISRASSFYNINEAKDNNNGSIESSEEDESSDEDESDDNEAPSGPPLPSAPEPFMPPMPQQAPQPPSPQPSLQPPIMMSPSPSPQGVGLPPPPGASQSKDDDDDFSDDEEEEDDEF